MNPDRIATESAAEYPDSDGQPMADNTLQWDWMVKIVGELREQFAGQQVFVAGDLLWYPVKGENKIRQAPDALVALSRPPGYRGSYKQWEEGGVAPQVVFEVLSPGNRPGEMDEKRKFYDRHGVEEYYFLDPANHTGHAWIRIDGVFEHVAVLNGYISPRLNIRFETNGALRIFGPDGREFHTREERVEEIQEELRKTALAFEEERTRALNALRQLVEEQELSAQEHERAEQEKRRAEQQTQRAEQQMQRAEQEAQRAEGEKAAKDVLAAKLRELGIDPDTVLKPAG